MAHSAEIRRLVRQSYIEGAALSTAAALHQVPLATARQWRAAAKEEWDKARTAHRTSQRGVDDLNRQMVEDFARSALATLAALDKSQIAPEARAQALAAVSDAYAKFSRAFSRINPHFSALSVALECVRLITEYLRAHAPDALKHWSEHLEAIGAMLSDRYGH